MRTRRYVIACAAVALVGSACANDDGDGATAEVEEPAAEEPAAEEPAAEEPASEDDPASDEPGEDPPDDPADGGTAADTPVIATADTELGTILVDGEGMTLYLFDDDTDGTSTCYEACAANWPPLLGEATVGGDADQSLVATTERDDGTQQVTYAGMPLYHYAADSTPGDATGQGVGGIWWVVGPGGERIADGAATGPGSSGY